MRKPKVLLLGWDAADWKIINKLVDRGEMPNMKNMITEGTMGNLSTLTPALSPMLWTSIATGMHADKHGIHGFTEPSADNSHIQPISVASRKVKAIWNILNQNNYKSHVINWWPSHPAEPVNGIYVSNLFSKVNNLNSYNEDVPENCIHPRELHELIAHMRMHPLELDLASIVPFIPKAKNKGIDINNNVLNLMNSIAEASSIQNAATFAIQNEEWDFTAVYWNTIDHICHSFMRYYPPKLESVSQTDFELYNEVVDGAYRLMDLMLGRLIQLAGKDTTIIIVSDHGFHSDHLRPLHIPNEPAGPIYQHRQLGIFCAKGPNIKKDHVIYGASLIDIAPTILSIFDLHIGKDMDGKPLTDIFNKQIKNNYIKSWDLITGDDGTIINNSHASPIHSQEAIKQLIDLGYIENPGSNVQKAIEKTTEELQYNLALVYYSTNRKSLAGPILKKLHDKYPYAGRFAFRLIECHIQNRDFDKAHKVLKKFTKNANDKILKKDQINSIKNLKAPIILNHTEKEQWNRDNKNSPIRNSTQALYDLKQSHIIEANLYIYEGKPKKAISILNEIETAGVVKNHNYFYQLASAYAKLGKWQESLPLFQKVIELDPENNIALTGLGYAHFTNGNYNEALEYTLNAIEINFYNPLSHFNLGQIFEVQNRYKDAAYAYEVSLKIAPGNGQARNKIISLYNKHLNEPAKAQKHKELQKTTKYEHDENNSLLNINDFSIKTNPTLNNKTDIIVVSGLPRSGTSMVMQMLNAAKIPIFADNKRQADENNPKGFFEHQKTRQILRNNNWLNEASGKAIKIVIPLLFNIPQHFNYKIIIILRDLKEIIDSQQKMLATKGKYSNSYPAGLEMTYAKYIDKLSSWTETNHNCEILILKHQDIITNPKSEAKKIIIFLNLKDKSNEMAHIVDNNLYRSRNI